MTRASKRRRATPTSFDTTPSVCTWNEEESSSSSSASKRQLSIRSFCFQTTTITTTTTKKTPETPPTPTVSSNSSVDTPPSNHHHHPHHPHHHETPAHGASPKRMIQKPTQRKLAQVFLDCGQRDWGTTVCPKCDMLYVPGVQEDTQQHEKVCRPIALGVLWRGTAGKLIPCQRLPNKNNNDGIRLILPSSKTSNSSSSQAALTAIFQIVANDLGMEPHSNTIMLQSQHLLYVRDQRVVGVATVEPIATAYRMKNLYERNNTPTKALLGIAVLWTHPTVRHQGIATRLIDAARKHAIFGMVVPKSQVAFSSPTQAGWAFGNEYCCGSTSSGGGETTTITTPLVYVYQRKSTTSTINSTTG